MHNNLKKFILSIIVGICLVMPFNFTEANSNDEDNVLKTHLTPKEIDGQTIYLTEHVFVEFSKLDYVAWDKIEISQNLGNQGLYFEIWDHQNRVVPNYKAQKLNSNVIDLSKIDASLYSEICLVIFKPESINIIPDEPDIKIMYAKRFNSRLIIFGTVIGLIYLLLIVSIIKYKIRIKDLIKALNLIFHNTSQGVSSRDLITYCLLIYLGGGVFGLTLGLYNGYLQMIYLLIKLPSLFICSFILSILACLCFALLMGIKTPIKNIISQSLSHLAITSITLASFSPIILFYIYLPQNHDELLISAIIFVSISYLLGILRFYFWLKEMKAKRRFIITCLWVILYGLVLLQLGWILRPWVGVIDPINNAVPFSRLYGGNVFVEIINVLERL
jgi:hypothetical protein